MSKIRILPEQLANQIAAGEVVERPASVVKELVENSLDAGATKIEVEIEGGGTRLIRIIDNGEGMDEDDLLLSLERHGTSKIRVAEDLHHIDTLGFRGEAIPSIGSVSIMEISSRTENAALGTQAVLKYGKLLKVHETGCAKGTIIEIKNLFGNTPARRKFLRTARTELGHIEEVMKNYALATPGVAFILTIDGRDVLHLDSGASLMTRVKTIIHHKGDMMEISGFNKLNEYGVHGYLVPPDEPVSGGAKLRFFVNGRAIKDRMITHAVNEGLRGVLMKGRYPAGLIHVTLPAEDIDVNVHPAKHEIRFKNSREVHRLVTLTIAETIQKYQARLKSQLFGLADDVEPVPLEREQASLYSDLEPTNDAPLITAEKQKPQQSPIESVQQTSPATPEKTVESVSRNVPAQESTSPPQPVPVKKEHSPYTFPETAFTEKPATTNQPVPATRDSRPAPFESPAQTKDDIHGLQVIGQLHNLYILCQNEQGMLVIDQHAAHERLLFEELRRQYLQGSVVRQTLMFPETVELTIFQTQLVEKNSEELDAMGFSLRDFGGNSFVISAIPALAGKNNATTLFLDVLEQFGSERGNKGANRLEDILADIACKAAVKSGHELRPVEIDALLDKMARANMFSHCPHGRPVFKQFSKDDVKKWFYRT